MSRPESVQELAYAALLLEKQLKSHQKLHDEEIRALWNALTELKHRILTLDPNAPRGLDVDRHREEENRDSTPAP